MFLSAFEYYKFQAQPAAIVAPYSTDPVEMFWPVPSFVPANTPNPSLTHSDFWEWKIHRLNTFCLLHVDELVPITSLAFFIDDRIGSVGGDDHALAMNGHMGIGIHVFD